MTGYGYTAHDTNVVSGGRDCGTGIVKLRRGSGKDWQAMAPKAKDLKAQSSSLITTN